VSAVSSAGFGDTAAGDEVGTGLDTATPLFQINLLPLLTQVNFFPPALLVAPSFEHAPPDFTAATALVPPNTRVVTIRTTK
jgi:hypothetical protein